MIQLPVTNSGNSEIDIVIDGVVYTFVYKYNTRNDRLYFSIYLEDEPMLSSIRMLDETSLITNYYLADFPSGQLAIIKFDTGNNRATLGTIGIDKEYSLIYIPDEELV